MTKTKKNKKSYLLSKEQVKKMKELRRTKKTKYKGNKFPFRNITKQEALHNFFSLKNKTNLNPRSLLGNVVVNYGTEKARAKTTREKTIAKNHNSSESY